MKRVTVVVSVPSDVRKPFRHAELPEQEAAAMVGEINAKGTINGYPASAFIASAPPSAPVKPEARRSRNHSGPVEPGRKVPGCIAPPRTVRASSTRWRGETAGNRWDRIVASDNRWDR